MHEGLTHSNIFTTKIHIVEVLQMAEHEPDLQSSDPLARFSKNNPALDKPEPSQPGLSTAIPIIVPPSG